MDKQVDGQKEMKQSSCQRSGFAYLAFGVGIGAALSVLFAPRPGEETRKWVANKGFDAIDAANKKVWQSRVHLKEIMDRGQLQITEAVSAGRKSFGKHEPESPVAVL
jgi:gas vesicle protein